MRTSGCDLPKFTTLLVILGVVGIVETAWADPKGSQRLRGLGDRTFAVEVTNLAPECFDEISENDPEDCNFTNCYEFLADGEWRDPLFSNPGHGFNILTVPQYPIRVKHRNPKNMLHMLLAWNKMGG